MPFVVFPSTDPRHATLDDLTKSLFGDDNPDDLAKAGIGFGRGEKAGHKYWKRVRVLVAGKLTWRYYYNTPQDRAQFLEDMERKRKRDNARSALARHEKRAVREADLVGADHALVSQFLKDHPELASKRRKLEDLNEDYVRSVLGWTSPVNITATDAVRTLFGQEVVEHFRQREAGGEEGEPEDLHGEKVHWLRAAEMSFQLIPREIREFSDGALSSIDFALASEDGHPRAAGYCEWGANFGGKSRIAMLYDKCFSGTDAKGMKGGLFPVEVMTHEFSHAVHMKMMHDPGKPIMPGSVSWDDWMAFHGSTLSKDVQKKDREPTITKYAQTNEYEAFAESFTATLMYPQQMAQKCPKTYEFFRKMFGEHNVRPAHTSEDDIRKLRERLEAATTGEERSRVLRQIEMSTGVLDMPVGDPRLEWWKASAANPVQQLLGSIPPENRPQYAMSSDTFRDPPNEDAVGDQGHYDRFYEMNYRGRTVYVRVTPADDGKAWDPSSSATSAANVVLKPDQIAEVYDENRQPLDPRMVYWHLHQDLFEDPAEVLGHVTVGEGAAKKLVDVTVGDIFAFGKFSRGGTTTEASSEKEEAVRQLLEAREPHKFLRSLTKQSNREVDSDGKIVWPGGGGRGQVSLRSYDEWKAGHERRKEDPRPASRELFERERAMFLASVSMMPQEVSLHEYRQRSGTFNYDKIGVAGRGEMDELEALGVDIERRPDGTYVWSREQEGKRRELIERLKQKQPGLARVTVRGKDGKFTDQRIVCDHRGRPVLDRVRYVNDNPDGTKTVIYTQRGEDGQHYVEDPMWRRILTPHGEAIRSPEHMEHLCREAAQNRRRAWVSIRTDRSRVPDGKGGFKLAPAGDTSRYLHVQVEFDGSGQPRLIGQRWADKLGKPEPRLDDLLEDDAIFGKVRENARPVVQAEQVRMQDAKPPTPEELIKRPGARVIISTYASEHPGTSGKDKDVVARLIRVIPGKAAGELPPKPRWDDMPDGHDNLEDENPPGKSQRIRKAEKEAMTEGLLPVWYSSTPKQREWFDKHFAPAQAQWAKTAEAETAKEYPTQYVFKGEVGGGAPGRVFRRTAENAVKDVRAPFESKVPHALSDDMLVYLHEMVEPRTGKALKPQLRIVLPTNGQWKAEMLEAMPGVSVDYETVFVGLVQEKRPVAIRLSVDAFHRFREQTGGALSLTDEANAFVTRNVEMLQEAKRRGDDQTHVLETDQITPDWLVDNWGVGLNKTLPSGAKFALADHQQRLNQKLLDNGGRVLAAHYMGTGKTISAIVGAKMMMKRPHPDDPEKLHPDNPKKVLIVAPLNTVEQWRQAAYDFDGGALVVGSGANDIPIEDFEAMSLDAHGDLVVVGPEYFTLHADRLKKLGFDGLVIDEVHLGIKNEQAERNKKVSEWNADMKMMMLLTGTPMTTSPADFVEYVRLLSKGQQWGDMDAKTFTEMYLEPTSVMQDLGSGRKGPKFQVKAAKRAELASILGQWMDIALPKDVRGKTLPAVRIEENEHAFMQGTQAQLYNLYMALVGTDVDVSALAEDEQARLSPDARKAVTAAKAVANCPAYKQGSTEPFITFRDEKPDAKGKMSKGTAVFQTFSPKWLDDQKVRGKAAGKWPTVQEMSSGEVAIYDLFCTDVLGASYGEIAGRPITDEQRAAMKAAGWPKKVDNPDFGPLGIRARGTSRPWNVVIDEQIDKAFNRGDTAEATRLTEQKRKRQEQIDKALKFQRHVREALRRSATAGGGGMPYDNVLAHVAAQHGIDLDAAVGLMQVHPVPTVWSPITEVKVGGTTVHLDARETGSTWVSDKSGSLHLLYDREDWDDAKNAPRSKGGFESVRAGDIVVVSQKAMKAAGIERPKVPAGVSAEDRAEWEQRVADWAPPKLRYTGAPAVDGKVELVRMDTGATIVVPTKEVSAHVASLMDPGKRASRLRADVAMTAGNAKSEELKAHIQRFHADGGGAGPDGERQMVLFANGILDGCRTIEATLRMQGFRDVNECIDGSPHFDKDDNTTKAGSPNGKYFVTYIGSTYIGNRDLNVDIFKKVKDKLGRDLPTSLFVNKCTEPRGRVKTKAPGGGSVEVNWAVYPGDTEDSPIRLSQWTPDQRAQIKAGFGIDTPESFVEVDQGDGTMQTLFFYGTPKSAKILRDIVLAGDPTKIADAEKASEVRQRIANLKAAYEAEAKKNVSDKPPLTAKQTTIFNNCEAIVCSDAAQVGMNLGNAVEMVMYDSLGSPMAEMQRITRSARMLPPAVDAALMGTDDNPGPFRKLKAAEESLFKAGPRGVPGGTISGLRLSSNMPNATTVGEGSTLTFSEALAKIRAGALQAADQIGATPKPDRAVLEAWQNIAAKCAYAQNLGGNAARAMFAELSTTPAPGATEPVIKFPATGIQYEKPEAGTYDAVASEEPEQAIRRALDAMTTEDRETIEKAGFVAQQSGGPTSDPVGIYLAMRAQEILDFVESKRDGVAKEMRAQAGGRVITDNDVSNRLIDMLTPEDRAILKTKKYLVNVRKIGAAAHVGQVVTNVYKDPESKEVVQERVHTGYELEQPVRTESSTRAVGRARMVSFEQILSDVQNRVTFEPPEGFGTVGGNEVTNISRDGIEKSIVVIGLPIPRRATC